MGLVAYRYLLSARIASVLAQNKHLAMSDRDIVMRHRHDETCKLEAKPRQDIQVSRQRDEKPCLKTRYVSRDSITAKGQL